MSTPFENDADAHAWTIASLRRATASLAALRAAVQDDPVLLEHFEYIEGMLAHGTKDAVAGGINGPGPKGSTPLLMLCTRGAAAAEVEELLALGANPQKAALEFNDAADIEMKDTETPLIAAAFQGHHEICKVLLRWRATRLEEGAAAEDVAAVGPNHCMHGSIRRGASAMLAACDAGHLDVVKLLIEKCDDLDVNKAGQVTTL